MRGNGSSAVVKAGAKAGNICFVDNGHDINCEITGTGRIRLKSGIVKKVQK